MGRSFFSDLSRRQPWLDGAEREARIAELMGEQSKDDIVVPDACRTLISDTSVAVVGGGLAGLSAARELALKGAIVTVFEARGQVGGRVLSKTTFATGRIVEYGAELVGAIHPRWLGLALRYKLGCIGRCDADLHMKAGLEARLELDKRLTFAEQTTLAEDMERRIFTPIGVLASKIADPAEPWRQPGLKVFDSLSVADLLIRTLGIARGTRLFLAMQQLMVNNNVAALDELNLLGLMCLVKGGKFGAKDHKLMGYWKELEIFRVSEGCQALARAMADELVTRWRGRLKTSSAVTKIDLTQRPEITWNELDASGRVVKTDRAGFDFVVFTVPPSVWSGVTITPVHPMDPGQVGIMNTGPAVKHFSALRSRAWMGTRAAPLGGALDLGQVWEGTDNQMRLPEQPLVLNVFAGGKIPSAFEPGLDRLFPGYAAARYQVDLMDWPNTPFVRCGYASPKKGQIFTVGQALNKPFAKRMVFAGEHTSMAFFGYMEGALQSGKRAARQVVKLACSMQHPSPKPSPRIAQTEQEVFGRDDRVRITDSFGIPARWVCAIDVYGKDPSHGGEVLADTRATGVLIGPRHVLTAGHVFQNTSIQVDGKPVRVRVSRVRVSPGRNGDNDDHPLGSAWSKSVHRVPAQISPNDYALVVLDRDLSTTTHKSMDGALGYWGQSPLQAVLRRLDPATLKDAEVTVIGYPGDRCGKDVISGDAAEKARKIAYCNQRMRRIWASTPWRASGELFVDPASGRLEHTADTYEGQSGGPICLRRDGTLELLGVHGGLSTLDDGTPTTRNRGARVTRAMLRNLCGWINEAAGKTIAELRNDRLVFVSASANEDLAGIDFEAEGESPVATRRRLGTLAKKIDDGLRLCAAALPKIEPSGRRELVEFAISMLQTHFFPKGHGLIDGQGKILHDGRRGLVQTRLPNADGAPMPFGHFVRLRLTASTPPDTNLGGRHEAPAVSIITLYAETLRDVRATVAARVAVHEMMHMLFTFVERVRGDRGDRVADQLLAVEPWRQLDMKPFASERQALLAPLADLRKALLLDATAEQLADHLIEETFAYAVGQQLDLAVRLTAPAGKPGPKISIDPIPVANVLLRQVLIARIRVPAKVLQSPSVAAASRAASSTIDALSAAMRGAGVSTSAAHEAMWR